MPTDAPSQDPQPTTPPKGGGDPEPAKTFTEDQVNAIVKDRLARDRAKVADYDDLKAKAERLDQLEASQKTQQQKDADQIAALAKRADSAEAEMLRLRVAMAKGLTAAQAKRLQGSTVEELEADADELLESFTPTGPRPTPPTTRPKERLAGGGDPTDEPEETDPAKLAAQVPRH